MDTLHNPAMLNPYSIYHNPVPVLHAYLICIIHRTHYEKSDWSRAFNQFTIDCELDMINAISAGDIAFIMSSSTSTWLLKPKPEPNVCVTTSNVSELSV